MDLETLTWSFPEVVGVGAVDLAACQRREEGPTEWSRGIGKARRMLSIPNPA